MEYSINAKDDPGGRCDKAHCQSFSWTTEPPTQEGWYWLGDIGIVHVVLETYPNGKKELVVYTAESGRGNEEPETVDYYCKIGFQWLGALPVPDLPEGF